MSSLASAIDDRRVFLGDLDLLGFAEIVQRGLLKRQANFFGDHLAAGQDRDVLQHGLATIAEARRLDGRNLDDAADVVDNQRRQRFAFDVFRDDDQRAAGLGDASSSGSRSRMFEIFLSYSRISGFSSSTC